MRAAVLLMGPTGAGKSELALELVQRFPLEIISVDSAQVYRGMDIGTAKPCAATRARSVHHLIDIRDPAAGYSAGEFARDAWQTMQDIWERGRQPLLVGGTMLYFHALTAGIAELPQADAAVRADIEEAAARGGWAGLHAELARVDPPAAARIHVNDPQRIQRALEVFRLTGDTITRLQQTGQSRLAGVQLAEIALAPAQRPLLHERIGQRLEAMLAAGFLQEVRTLYERGDLRAEHSSMRAVGYRQLWQHLAGECPLELATERAVVATRQLAKRQWTWLRRRPKAVWFDAMHPDVAAAVSNALYESVFAGRS
jgi:tRNA dimethylallyltransferase